MATIPPRGSKRLGRQVELDEDDKNCYVDLVLVLPGFYCVRFITNNGHATYSVCFSVTNNVPSIIFSKRPKCS
jgi:hypothetical protein